MNQVSHSRSVIAAIIGLIVQAVAFLAVLIIAYYIAGVERPYSHSLHALAWLLAGGLPIWLGILLVSDQKRRAEDEDKDLDLLRREREATGGSTTIFEEEGTGIRVAANRLEWMQRWMLPSLGLLTGTLLSVGGGYLIYALRLYYQGYGVEARALEDWWLLNQEAIPVAIIALSIVLLATFLFSRYASGMGRVAEWQMLRAGGSFLLGATIAIALCILSFGLIVYSGGSGVALDYYLAWAIPCLMILLGVEMVLNFILDLYRPRTPGIEPRAAFDSRLLGLFAEPGGIASSIAEAINYQFGFEVSKTWFYQLVMRSAIPLAGMGALTLWLMTTIVIVDPHEHGIIERLGRQVSPDKPLKSGWHMKAPWPWDVVRKFNTGNVNQMYIGFEIFDAEPDMTAADATGAMLWVQDQHLGNAHWEFMIPRPDERDDAGRFSGLEESVNTLDISAIDESSSREAAAVNLVRMIFEVHYRIDPMNLVTYTQNAENAPEVLLYGAWRESSRFSAMQDIHTLLSRSIEAPETLAEFTADLKRRLDERADELGLEIVYLGLQNVHPEKTVSESYRDVVNAQAEKVSKIREARGDENRILSDAAGRPDRARLLATAIEESGRFSSDSERAQELLSDISPAVIQSFEKDLKEFYPAFESAFAAKFEARQLGERYSRTERDFNLGIGFSQGQVSAAKEDLIVAERQTKEAEASLDEALKELSNDYSGEEGNLLLAWGRAKMAADFWEERLNEQLIGLQGEAAVALSQARASRWREELKAASQVARLRLESEAFRRAPNVYRARLLYRTLSEEYAKTRKYIIGFDPNSRDVHIRYQAEEQVRPGGRLKAAVDDGK